MEFGLSNMPGLLKNQFTNTEGRRPNNALEVSSFDSISWQNDGIQNKIIWFGHSVALLKIGGQNFLIDPLFGDDTTPVAPVKSARYSKNTLAIIDQLPPIDAVFISHYHYDHPDYRSIKRLKEKVNHFFVPLGVARHLERWGVSSEKIMQMDWWEETNISDVVITFVPSRHLSGRGLTDR
ncbi:MBL fold metallo-hydrolase [Cryomorpha ignava]|uniref:MBL fold metallo-hydrolase n=1 Tax=Cryomorpha ignava TaxID=101383 RepID=A0A7K3WVD8_9FLAO|nr:MBL fold metallo-hydrolase [Cryomorpha ignava]